MYLEIKNKGLIEPEALTLLGGTTKRDDSTKIGMFGSGNKYALAYFIRNNIKINIYSGESEIIIGTKDKHFRGMDMKVITVNGGETSITSETGPGWDLWQCIREIYSNAVDEGIVSFALVDEMTPSNDVTSIYLQATEGVVEFMEKKERYIYSKDSILFECSFGRILKKYGKTANIYRKGIRCYDTTMESLYDYDIFDIDINESRIVNQDTKMKQAIWALLSKCDKVEIVRNFIENHASQSTLENNYYLDYWSSNQYVFDASPAWEEVLKGKLVAPYDLGGYVNDLWRDITYFVHKDLYRKLVSVFGREISALKGANGDNIQYIVREPSPLQSATIKKAKEFFSDCEFEVDYPVFIADFLVDKPDALMGLAHDGSILISSHCIEKGVQYVVDTIFEEYVHLKHGTSDETRSMQNALISEMINYMKVKNCIVL